MLARPAQPRFNLVSGVEKGICSIFMCLLMAAPHSHRQTERASRRQQKSQGELPRFGIVVSWLPLSACGMCVSTYQISLSRFCWHLAHARNGSDLHACKQVIPGKLGKRCWCRRLTSTQKSSKILNATVAALTVRRCSSAVKS